MEKGNGSAISYTPQAHRTLHVTFEQSHAYLCMQGGFVQDVTGLKAGHKELGRLTLMQIGMLWRLCAI